MESIKVIINFVFASALVINALVFIPQAIKIFREKGAKNVSLVTFLGFLGTQFAVVLHGLIVHDYILVGGYLLSMLTCGSVILLVIKYKKA